MFWRAATRRCASIERLRRGPFQKSIPLNCPSDRVAALHCRQVLESSDPKVGFNAATGAYEDMFAAGIIDPAKVGTP